MAKQKVWVVTGAARGIGLEIVKAVLATGDQVIATVRRSPETLLDKLGKPANLSVEILDITNEAQAKEAADQIVQKFGKIDVLVNNAGFGLLSAVEEASADEVRKNFETNVFGLLNVTRAVLPYMRNERSGHIINISSVGGLSGNIGWGVYGSTKFAVEGLTESLALELAPLGIHATVVAPGFFRTDFLDASSLSNSDRIIPDYAETVGKMREFAVEANRKQPGDPVKLAKAIVQVANAEKPPVHLPLGKDSLQRYREKTADFERDIENWYDVITGTDHDDV
ncbi:oxidoreductase [Paenibacillus harenae]|jgi:NAD(P)-dependent dehydrogenase (short-subunit alcohol dehydrogenase family)|uniref:oxidoreductase n=1 Tax=Paenibacillus harenae TaxID=306543 RepID=UPI002794A7A9|nr:oxidoreductase [Paenibacillus harenae]MDQ0060212.1 NAD(P)-dependent dehydrogenase (short-subunit alcohol dehydrogenase family) [Paenibacillus harenae]